MYALIMVGTHGGRSAAAGFKRKRGKNAPPKRIQEHKGKELQVKPNQGGPLIQIPTPLPFNANTNGRRVNFILENAAIKKLRVKKKWKVPSSLDDGDVILGQRKNVDDYRCDIVHDALRAILDSPLNRYGMVGAIFIKLEDGVLFEVKPQVRIPRMLDRFCGLMSDLLDKSCIRNEETHEILLRVIEEPVTRYLPASSRIVGFSCSSKKLVNMEDYLSSSTDDMNLTFVVGTSAHKDINAQYTDDVITVSSFPSSARDSIRTIVCALEQKWDVF